MADGSFYDIANTADITCQSAHCQRADCNGFLCLNALDAVYQAGMERAAKIAENHAGVPYEADGWMKWRPSGKHDIAAAIRAEKDGLK